MSSPTFFFFEIVFAFFFILLNSFETNYLLSVFITGHIFLLLYKPDNFLLDTRHCKFYLLGAEYFCILINIPELCSGKELSFLKTV